MQDLGSLLSASEIRNAIILFIVGTIAGVGALLTAFGLWLRRKLESDSRSQTAETEKEQAEARMLNTAADALNDLVVNSAEERAEFLRTLNKLLDDNRELRDQVAKLQEQHNLLRLEVTALQGELNEERRLRDIAEQGRAEAEAETQRIRDEYASERATMKSQIEMLEKRVKELSERKDKSA